MSGPVLKVADPLLLGQYVDGAILSTLRDVSQIHKVYEASERLKLAGVKVVGAVINGVEEHQRVRSVQRGIAGGLETNRELVKEWGLAPNSTEKAPT